MAQIYTDEDLVTAANTASSPTHALRLLGQNCSTKNQRILIDRLSRIGFSDSFFKGKRTRLPKATIKNALIKKSPYSPGTIRNLILQEELLPMDCCGLAGEECPHKKNGYFWIAGKKVTMHLHHINGSTRDNRLENLAWMCITCHGNTDNFGGKGR